jgi:hypothetical protein
MQAHIVFRVGEVAQFYWFIFLKIRAAWLVSCFCLVVGYSSTTGHPQQDSCRHRQYVPPLQRLRGGMRCVIQRVKSASVAVEGEIISRYNDLSVFIKHESIPMQGPEVDLKFSCFLVIVFLVDNNPTTEPATSAAYKRDCWFSLGYPSKTRRSAQIGWQRSSLPVCSIPISSRF